MIFSKFISYKVGGIVSVNAEVITTVGNDSFIRSRVSELSLPAENGSAEMEVFCNNPWQVKEGMSVKWATGPGNLTLTSTEQSKYNYKLVASSVLNDEIDRTQVLNLETTVPPTKSIKVTVKQSGLRQIVLDSAGSQLQTSDGLTLIALK